MAALNFTTTKESWTFDPRSIGSCGLWLDAADSNTLTSTTPTSSSFSSYVTTSAQTVSPGNIASVSSITSGICVIGGAFISNGSVSGLLAPSATAGDWYAYCIDGIYSKAIKIRFALTSGTLTVVALSAGFTSTTGNYIYNTNSGATNDTYYGLYSPQTIATSQGGAGYGVASFTINYTPNSSVVSQWNDKSGNAKHFTSTGSPLVGNTTLNGLNLLDLRAGGYFSNASFTLPVTYSVFAVGYVPTPQTYNTLVAASTDLIFILRGDTGGFCVFWGPGSGGWTTIYNSNAITTPFLTTFINNNATSIGQLWSNTTSIGTATRAAASFTGTLGVGYRPGSGSDQYWKGYIAEFLIFTGSALSTAQRQAMEGYLAWKWGLRTSISSTHPYRYILPYSRAFTPLSIQGCALWLDGADPNATGVTPSNGATVSTWVDKSGNGNNATAGTSPTFNSSGINNKGVISFNGSSQFLNTQDLYSGRSFAVFTLVRRQASIPGQTGILAGTTFGTNLNLGLVWTTNTTLRLGFFNNDLDYTSFPTYTGNSTTEPAYLITWYYTSGTRQIYVNGALAASDANATNLISNNSPVIGKWSSTFWTGFIGELITYNGVLTASERQQVEGYLANKWGLRSSQVTTNPFRSALLPAAVAFLPTQISNIAAWWDGSDPNGNGNIPTNGSSIISWIDKSGSGLNLARVGSSNVPTYSYTGLNGKPALTFSTSFLQTTSTIVPATAFTTSSTDSSIYIVLVLAGDNGSTTSSPFGLNTTDNNYVLRTPWALGNKYWDCGDRLNYVSTTNGTYIISLVRTGTLMEIYNNGTRAALMNTASVTVTTISQFFNIGVGTPAAANWFQNSIGEIIIYKGGASTTQRQAVEGYLAWKWGLQRNLPSTHPYYKIKI